MRHTIMLVVYAVAYLWIPLHGEIVRVLCEECREAGGQPWWTWSELTIVPVLLACAAIGYFSGGKRAVWHAPAMVVVTVAESRLLAGIMGGTGGGFDWRISTEDLWCMGLASVVYAVCIFVGVCWRAWRRFALDTG